MNPRQLRFLAYAGILLTLFLSTWYLMKTYKEGNPRWIFLLMAVGMVVILGQNLTRSRRG